MQNRIVVAHSINPDVLTFHTTVELSVTGLYQFSRPLEDWADEKLKKTGAQGEKLVRTILAIPGINALYISPYNLQAEKGTAFDWADIRPLVLSAIRGVFEAKDVGGDIAVEDRKCRWSGSARGPDPMDAGWPLDLGGEPGSHE